MCVNENKVDTAPASGATGWKRDSYYINKYEIENFGKHYKEKYYVRI